MRVLMGIIGITAIVVVAGTMDIQAANEPSTIAPGGGKSPAT